MDGDVYKHKSTKYSQPQASRSNNQHPSNIITSDNNHKHRHHNNQNSEIKIELETNQNDHHHQGKGHHPNQENNHNQEKNHSNFPNSQVPDQSHPNNPQTRPDPASPCTCYTCRAASLGIPPAFKIPHDLGTNFDKIGSKYDNLDHITPIIIRDPKTVFGESFTTKLFNHFRKFRISIPIDGNGGVVEKRSGGVDKRVVWTNDQPFCPAIFASPDTPLMPFINTLLCTSPQHYPEAQLELDRLVEIEKSRMKGEEEGKGKRMDGNEYNEQSGLKLGKNKETGPKNAKKDQTDSKSSKLSKSSKSRPLQHGNNDNDDYLVIDDEMTRKEDGNGKNDKKNSESIDKNSEKSDKNSENSDKKVEKSDQKEGKKKPQKQPKKEKVIKVLNPKDDKHSQIKPTLEGFVYADSFPVEAIRDHSFCPKLHFTVKWKDYPEEDNSEEPPSNLSDGNVQQDIVVYCDRLRDRPQKDLLAGVSASQVLMLYIFGLRDKKESNEDVRITCFPSDISVVEHTYEGGNLKFKLASPAMEGVVWTRIIKKHHSAKDSIPLFNIHKLTQPHIQHEVRRYCYNDIAQPKEAVKVFKDYFMGLVELENVVVECFPPIISIKKHSISQGDKLQVMVQWDWEEIYRIKGTKMPRDAFGAEWLQADYLSSSENQIIFAQYAATTPNPTSLVEKFIEDLIAADDEVQVAIGETIDDRNYHKNDKNYHKNDKNGHHDARNDKDSHNDALKSKNGLRMGDDSEDDDIRQTKSRQRDRNY